MVDSGNRVPSVGRGGNLHRIGSVTCDLCARPASRVPIDRDDREEGLAVSVKFRRVLPR
jgi:hypothetical protein